MESIDVEILKIIEYKIISIYARGFISFKLIKEYKFNYAWVQIARYMRVFEKLSTKCSCIGKITYFFRQNDTIVHEFESFPFLKYEIRWTSLLNSRGI